MADKELDCKGLMCPMPIVKISKISKEMSSGQTLQVTATDPAFKADVDAWCTKTGNTLESVDESGGTITAVIKIA